LPAQISSVAFIAEEMGAQKRRNFELFVYVFAQRYFRGKIKMNMRYLSVMIYGPECVMLKRHGAEHVSKLIASMSQQEQLEFWQKRTIAMIARQKESQQKKTALHDTKKP